MSTRTQGPTMQVRTVLRTTSSSSTSTVTMSVVCTVSPGSDQSLTSLNRIVDWPLQQLLWTRKIRCWRLCPTLTTSRRPTSKTRIRMFLDRKTWSWISTLKVCMSVTTSWSTTHQPTATTHQRTRPIWKPIPMSTRMELHLVMPWATIMLTTREGSKPRRRRRPFHKPSIAKSRTPPNGAIEKDQGQLAHLRMINRTIKSQLWSSLTRKVRKISKLRVNLKIPAEE